MPSRIANSGMDSLLAWNEPAHTALLHFVRRASEMAPMKPDPSPPVTLCRYWVKPDQEQRFRELLSKHWPVFSELGLVANDPPHLIFRGEDKERGIFYVETFAWKDAGAMERAHSLPEVMAIWGPMGECCSSMEFPSVEQIKD